MDSGSQARRKREITKASEITALKQKPFSEIESHFLNLLVSDVDGAWRLVRILKRGNLSLTEVETARKDRLIGRYYEV